MTMDQTGRSKRSAQDALVVLPDAPGILAAMALAPAIETHLRGLAQALLVDAFPDSSLTRAEREVIATAVSGGNGCYFCHDSHAAFTRENARREKWSPEDYLVVIASEGVVRAPTAGRLWALVRIAERVRVDPLTLTDEDVKTARDAGASNGDIQLAVLIASAFCMYNRMVEGLRAKTPPEAGMHQETAVAIADNGYIAA